MIGLSQQSKPVFTDMCTPSELLGHKGRRTKRGFAIEEHDGRRRRRCISDGKALPGGVDSSCFVSSLPVTGYRLWVGVLDIVHWDNDSTRVLMPEMSH